MFAPAHPDLKGVRTLAGDYHEGDLGEAMDKQPLVADVVETWLKHGVGRPTLCFAVNRAARAAHRRAVRGARRSRRLYRLLHTGRRAPDIRRKFASGEYQVVCNVGVLTIGIDWDVRCIILARPTKSEMLYVQIIGRGLRTAEGKDHCLILDHSDTTLRLGFVTEIITTSSMTARRASITSATHQAAEGMPQVCVPAPALDAGMSELRFHR